MQEEKEILIEKIDSIIEKVENTPRSILGRYSLLKRIELYTLLRSAISKFSPPNSWYREQAINAEGNTVFFRNPRIIIQLAGALKALRTAYNEGLMLSVREIIHAEVFDDFLDMADHLFNEQNLKEPAAVIGGGVLEQHLIELCKKNKIDTLKPNGKPKKADTLNSDLKAAGVYSKTEHKEITAWYGIRNHAAHGEHDKYTEGQVDLMLRGIRHFISRFPA